MGELCAASVHESAIRNKEYSMLTFRRLFLAGGALLCAAVLAHCDSNTASNTDGGAADSGASSDLLAAAPVLTMVSPSSAVNTGGTMVTLTGTNFQPGATVTFAGVAATNVTVVSSTQITCTVPAKAATCGAVPVQVSNPDGKMAARTDAFFLSTPTLSFAAVSSLPMATNPRQVIAADLNNDAKLDLISANSGSANVTVRLGNGDGTFGAVNTVAIGTGTSPYAVAAADA